MIREHASSLNPQDEFEAPEWLELRRKVQILESLHAGLDDTAFARGARDLTGKGDAFVDCSQRQYQAVYLVKCLVMANALRNSASLQQTVLHAMRLVLPQVLLPAFERMLETSKQHFPHESTISRWRMLLDGAFMLLHRQLNSQRSTSHRIRYLLADSSVQHRRDFEHVVLCDVAVSQLPDLFQAAHELEHLCGFCALVFSVILTSSESKQIYTLLRHDALDDDEQVLEGEVRLLETLTSGLQTHRLPIMALGSGRTALCDKYLSVMHAFFLEAGTTEQTLAAFTD
eukprot:19730-Amphidinium_carterae.1